MPYDIKKLLASAAAIGALGFGGSAIAGATTNNDQSPAAREQSSEQHGAGTEDAAETPGSEAGHQRDAKEPDAEVNPADEKRAGDAALAEVGSGKVSEVSAETTDANEPADKPEKGDKADPSYENQIAYDVEVTKADGSTVDVALDKSFSVLGTEAADQNESGDQGGEAGEQADASEVAPAK